MRGGDTPAKKGGNMKIKISEVWNWEGKSVEIGRIEVADSCAGVEIVKKVEGWIEQNRPDLSLAVTLTCHGYHAKRV